MFLRFSLAIFGLWIFAVPPAAAELVFPLAKNVAEPAASLSPQNLKKDIKELEESLATETKKAALLQNLAATSEKKVLSLRAQTKEIAADQSAVAEDLEEQRHTLRVRKAERDQTETALREDLQTAQRHLASLLRHASATSLMASPLADRTIAENALTTHLFSAFLKRVAADIALLKTHYKKEQQAVAMAEQEVQWQERRHHNLLWQQDRLADFLNKEHQNWRTQRAEEEALQRDIAELQSEAENLRRLMQRLNKEPGPALPGGALQDILIPTAGKIVRSFGSKDSFGLESDGLTLAGRALAPVLAPADGKVVFKGPFRGYGEILILQHGGSYHSLITGFDAANLALGEMVKRAQVLGRLPAEGRSFELYYELRVKGEPVDPVPYFGAKMMSARAAAKVVTKTP
jgi:murein hydrolase activator